MEWQKNVICIIKILTAQPVMECNSNAYKSVTTLRKPILKRRHAKRERMRIKIMVKPAIVCSFKMSDRIQQWLDIKGMSSLKERLSIWQKTVAFMGLCFNYTVFSTTLTNFDRKTFECHSLEWVAILKTRWLSTQTTFNCN